MRDFTTPATFKILSLGTAASAALLAIASLGIASSANAGGPVSLPPQPMVVAPMTPASPSWEGFYIGGQLGYAWGDFSLDPGDFDDSNFIGGLTAGYLWGFGNGWYIGPEFQYDWADLSITDPDTDNTASFDEIARLKLILGKELGNGLLYGSLGYAYGSVSDVQDIFDGSDDSYSVGIGYDWRLAENWALGLEYQYSDFNGIGDAGGDVAVDTLHLKATYRF